MKSLSDYIINESIDTKDIRNKISELERMIKSIKSNDTKFYDLEMDHIKRSIDTIKDNLDKIESKTFFEPGDAIYSERFNMYGVVKSITSSTKMKLVFRLSEEPSRHLKREPNIDDPNDWWISLDMDEYISDGWRLATDEERGDMFRLLRDKGFEYNPSTNKVKRK